MEILWQELTTGLHGSPQLERVLLRLVAAVLLGALVGLQRESTRKPGCFLLISRMPGFELEL
jgi:hypothetical protein